MKIICTVCSREKDRSRELLPASRRYTGKHIMLVNQIAERQQSPFFILSGRYGLLGAEEKIWDYDHLLEHHEIHELSQLVNIRLSLEISRGARELDFYTKEKEPWTRYQEVIKEAVRGLPIALHIKLLGVKT